MPAPSHLLLALTLAVSAASFAETTVLTAAHYLDVEAGQLVFLRSALTENAS